MSRNRNDELPDDLIDKLKLLNEQPDDYDADTRPLVPLNEEDIGSFRPPEPALRVGVRDSSYLNYRAWGYISEDERILLSDEGEVYVKIDEVTFGTTDAIKMMVEEGAKQASHRDNRLGNLEIGLTAMLRRNIRSNVIHRLCNWLKNARLGR